jgi:NAD(P)-dependent dehydrogenase (short-subunit alcohol dehydrogenase family)
VGGPLGTIVPRDWDWIIDVNLKSVIYGVETFYPLIRSHGEGGHIINTASMAGIISPPGLEPYSATKFAVVAMSEGWAIQLQPLGIGVSVLCPGFVRTRIHESGRARPDRYGGRGEVDAGIAATQREAAENVLHGIDPEIVGTRVVEAVKAGELYIFTHPPMRDFVEARFQAIRAAFEAAAASPSVKSVKEWAPVWSATPQAPK